MATTIFRVEKHKSFETMRSAGAHQFRFMETPNADTEKFKLNKTLIGGNNIEKSAKELLAQFNVKPRKNAVLAMDGLITLSPEALKSNADVKKFANEAIKFLKGKFGKRCISAVLHMDETSPHIHFTTIPIEKCPKKGYKLNARDQFSKTTLAQMQRDVFEHMHKAFPELTPPKHGNKADHNTLKAFYNGIEAEADRIKQEMNAELEGIKSELLDNIKQRMFTALDGFANNEFVRTRNKIGAQALDLIRDYEAGREELHKDISNAIDVEANRTFVAQHKVVEQKVEEIKDEIQKPKSKFKF